MKITDLDGIRGKKEIDSLRNFEDKETLKVCYHLVTFMVFLGKRLMLYFSHYHEISTNYCGTTVSKIMCELIIDENLESILGRLS